MASPTLPAKMVEEILLFLPAKSLLRFSSVSKAWKSLISEAGFVKRYRGRAAVPGRERYVLDVDGNSLNIESRLRWENEVLADGGRICTFSCTSESSPEVIMVFPSESQTAVWLKALCDELWLATVDGGPLFLWNPSMRSSKHIPDPSRNEASIECWGLGYDSVDDDYKILRISSGDGFYNTAELYSLRSDGWRMIAIPDDFSTEYCYIREPAVCVSGNLHFTCCTYYSYDDGDDDYYYEVYDIISFNLSSEKFGKMALPNYSPKPYQLELLSVLRGMLSQGVKYDELSDEKFVIWVMEEYGVDTSWTKKFCIKQYDPFFGHTPLYYGENGEVLIVAYNERGERRNLVYEDEKSRPVEFRYRNNSCPIFDVFTYVESLVGLDWQCSQQCEEYLFLPLCRANILNE